MEFRILGPLEVAEDGAVVTLSGPKQRSLLAILLLSANKTVSSDRLIDELWGERSPESGRTALQVRVSQLRKALGPGGAQLLTRAPGYVLRVDPEQLDLYRFERLVREADTAKPVVAAAKLREALELWRGDPLADLSYESFAQSAIVRLREFRMTALEQRVEADLALGRHKEVVGELEALVAEHPLRERLRGQLMLALYRCGRQADALEAYQRARTHLGAELGLEPGPELKALQTAILTQDQALLGQRQDVTSRPPIADARPPPKVPRSSRRAWLLAAAGATIGLVAAAAGIARLQAGGSSSPRLAPNSVVAIDARSNAVVDAVPVGSGPGAISAGSGSLWVANDDDHTISRIDAVARRVVRTFTVRAVPDDLAATDKSVWVVGSNTGADSVSVDRIDPQFNSIAPVRRLPIVVPGYPGSVATEGGTVWIAPASGLLTRLDIANGRILKRVDAGVSAAAVAVGEGAVWIVDGDANSVTRVDPTGLRTSIAVGNGPTAIAAGAGGVWVIDELDDSMIRIDPHTFSVTTTIPVGRSPGAVAIADGSVWVANGGDGTVSRIDPRTGKVIATIAVGGSPAAIAFANGRVWVTVGAQTNTVGAVDSAGTLRIESRYGPLAIDPALAYDPTAWSVLYTTCVKPFNYPDRSGAAGAQLTPEAADSIPSPSAGGRTYTFTIRSGFRFSPPSNEPVTAQTFKDTIERALNPRMHSPVAYYFTDILGAGAYMSGKARHIAGVVAHANTLMIRLRAPRADFLSRLALPILCAVPSNTPIDPNGVSVIPGAGPYHVTSYGQGSTTVLERNPNYHGSRPHVWRRIELTAGISSQRAVRDIETGRADYAPVEGVPLAATAQLRARLASRYGPDSPVAARGGQQYFVHPVPSDDFFVLNTHRPLFSDVRLRQAVNYAIDRRAVASLGDGQVGPDLPTDHYLPPEIPGSSGSHVYPITPNLAKARALARGNRKTAVLYTCNFPSCAPQAQIVKNDLARIGLRVLVKQVSPAVIIGLAQRGGTQPFDLVLGNWVADYPDPAAMLNGILDNPSYYPTFDDPTFRRRMAAAARLSGPARYLAFGKLDVDLRRDAAPVIVYGNALASDFFSSRVGCQTNGFYVGPDLAALCIRPHTS